MLDTIYTLDNDVKNGYIFHEKNYLSRKRYEDIIYIFVVSLPSVISPCSF